MNLSENNTNVTKTIYYKTHKNAQNTPKTHPKTAPLPSRNPPQDPVPDATNSAKSTARMRTERPIRQQGSTPRSIKRRTVLVQTESCWAVASTDRSVGSGAAGGAALAASGLAFVMARSIRYRLLRNPTPGFRSRQSPHQCHQSRMHLIRPVSRSCGLGASLCGIGGHVLGHANHNTQRPNAPLAKTP